MNIQKRTNGYTISAKLQETLTKWEEAAAQAFGDQLASIEEFYYGSCLVMADIHLKSGSYGDFNVCQSRISFNSHTSSMDEYKIFGQLTLNDECFPGGLIEE